jgi:hypothetical protein
MIALVPLRRWLVSAYTEASLHPSITNRAPARIAKWMIDSVAKDAAIRRGSRAPCEGRAKRLRRKEMAAVIL